MLRLSMRARIFIGFGVVAVVLAAQLGVALTSLSRVRALRRERAEVLAPRVEAADAVERAVLYRAISFRNLLVTRAEQHRLDYASAVASSRAELQRLRSLSAGDAAASPLVRELDLRLPDYEIARDRMFAAVVTGEGLGSGDAAELEVQLSAARERFLEAVRAYRAAQASRSAEVAARIDAAEVGVGLTLAASAAVVVLVLVATAVLTHRGVRRPAARLVDAARALEGGDFGPAKALAAAPVTSGDELEALAGAFGRMGVTLHRREERLAAEGRVSAGIASSLDLAQVTERAAAEVARFCGAELAVVYVRDGDRLARVAGYCAAGAPAALAADGIVGQALASGRTVVVEPPPGTGPLVIGLGLGEAPPGGVAAVPLTLDGTTSGVLVLASLRPLATDALPFAERAAVQLAIAAGNAAAHRRVEALATELQGANAALTARNAELQAQGEALQAQSEELQSQSEELQAQTEELHAQADEIHRQNDELRANREALQRRTEALEGVDRRKVEFLAQLGHELRNPLAAIANAAHLLEARAGSGRPSRHVAVVSRQVRQLRRLVDDLLDVSRINHGKVELRVEPTDLRRIVEGALDATRPALEGKGHDVEVAVPEDLVVRVDPARMQQVISNLLHNAARYTPHGGHVRITGERADGEVRLSVRDTGIGIASDLLPQIFEPFAQGDHTEKHGLGLGLALVHRFVHLHGGEVEARSEGPGRGSEFTVRLPAAVEDRRPAPAAPAVAATAVGQDPAARTAAPRLPPTALAGPPPAEALRILVVDDNEDLAETMGEMLRSFGHEVEVELEPEPALERAVADPPDVALLDIGLPRMDGYALARAIRTALPDAPLLLVAATGYAQPDDRTRALEAGFDLHLAKPVDPEELRAVLARAAEERARTARGDVASGAAA